MIEIIAYSLLSILVGFLIVVNIYFFAQYRSYLKKYLTSGVENLILRSQITDRVQNSIENNVTETEGFIKFLSDSREWAFGYIEEVQAGIQELKVAMDANDNEAITNAYQKLVSYLPNEES